MIIRIREYKGKYRVVSLAFDEDVRNDLQKNELDVIYVSDDCITLYPDNIILSREKQIIEKLQQGNNYDVYELGENGKLSEYYNDSSIDNYFFITGKCNSNCIMCPSSDVSRKNGWDTSVENLIEIAKHIPTNTPHLTITGGEPFMIGKEIFRFISFLRDKFESTEFLFLTNGRIFAVDAYAKQLRDCIPENSIMGIPIHGSKPEIHDLITQTNNSFLQTVTGIKKLLRLGIRVELRIVVSNLNANDIEDIAWFIVNEISEISYVSIMAMEMTGSAYINRDKVWIPYREAARKIQKGIIVLIEHGIDVKLYNFPLCTVEKKFWTLCEKSISPEKVRYSKQCNICRMKKACGGIFAGTLLMEKGELKAII